MSKPSALTIVSLLALTCTVASTVAFFVLDDVRLEPATLASTAFPLPQPGPGLVGQAFYASTADSPGRLLVASYGRTMDEAKEEARRAFRAWRASGYAALTPATLSSLQPTRGYQALVASA